MSNQIVVNSFAELAQVLKVQELAPAPPEEIEHEASVATEAAVQAPDLGDLLARLERASATLAAVARRDEEDRTLALSELDRYDALVAEQCSAEAASQRASEVRVEAEALAENAFSDDARDAATRVAGLAARAEAEAGRVAEGRRQEIEALGQQIDLRRLLAERYRMEEAEKARAAAAERAGRLSGALAGARAALDAGRIEEARELLGTVVSENPNNAEVASLWDIIARRDLMVKVSEAEDALWATRRVYRHDPAAAVARFEALDIEGLPAPLASQVFGEWARACSYLCRQRQLQEPLRYSPDPSRGAILAREGADTPYVIVSALGMSPRWRVGVALGERQLRRARPLR
ncbi:MAG: hypothetical protein KGJ86_15085 [Chloroflexota bacterium]|nr:hypothetical protein [Chloroflexota bacterium]